MAPRTQKSRRSRRSASASEPLRRISDLKAAAKRAGFDPAMTDFDTWEDSSDGGENAPISVEVPPKDPLERHKAALESKSKSQKPRDLFALQRTYQEALQRAQGAAAEASGLRESLRDAEKRVRQQAGAAAEVEPMRGKIKELRRDVQRLKYEKGVLEKDLKAKTMETSRRAVRTRAQLAALRSSLDAVEDGIAERKKGLSTHLRNLRATLVQLERHTQGGYKTVPSVTFYTLIQKLSAGVGAMAILVGEGDSTVVGRIRDRMEHSEACVEETEKQKYESTLADLSADLERENARLRDALATREKELAKSEDRAAAADLLPEYREVITRARRHAEKLGHDREAALSANRELDARVRQLGEEVLKERGLRMRAEKALLEVKQSWAYGQSKAKISKQIAAAALGAVRAGLEAVLDRAQGPEGPEGPDVTQSSEGRSPVEQAQMLDGIIRGLTQDEEQGSARGGDVVPTTESTGAFDDDDDDDDDDDQSSPQADSLSAVRDLVQELLERGGLNQGKSSAPAAGPKREMDEKADSAPSRDLEEEEKVWEMFDALVGKSGVQDLPGALARGQVDAMRRPQSRTEARGSQAEHDYDPHYRNSSTATESPGTQSDLDRYLVDSERSASPSADADVDLGVDIEMEEGDDLLDMEARSPSELIAPADDARRIADAAAGRRPLRTRVRPRRLSERSRNEIDVVDLLENPRSLEDIMSERMGPRGEGKQAPHAGDSPQALVEEHRYSPVASESERSSVLERDVRQLDAEIAALRRSIEKTAENRTAEFLRSLADSTMRTSDHRPPRPPSSG